MDEDPSRLSDGVFPYLTSALNEEDDAAAVGDACGKFKTYKTYKQTSFQEEATASCRHRRAYRGSLAAKCQLSLLATGN